MRTNRSPLFSRSPRAPRYGRALAALAGASIVGLAAAPAMAAGLSVNVQAPAGKGCISSDKLKSAVQQHVRGSAKPAAVDVQIEAADPGPGWVADVTVAGRPGRRSVRTPSASCSKLDEGLVLVVTMLADPDDEDPPPAAPPKAGDPADDSAPAKGGSAWGDEPADDDADDEPGAQGKKAGAPKGDSPNAPQPEGGDHGNLGKKGDKGSPNKESGDKDSGDAESGDKDAPKKGGAKKGGEKDDAGKKLQFGIGVSGVYAAGLVPAPAPGVRVAFSWLSPTPVGVEAAFTYYTPVEQYTLGTTPLMRHVETFSLELQVCPAKVDVGRLHFGACAGVAATRYQHYGVDENPVPTEAGTQYAGYGTTDDWMASSIADLRFDVALFSAMRLGVGMQAMVPINRPGEGDWLTSYNFGAFAQPVIFQARMGITVVLPP